MNEYMIYTGEGSTQNPAGDEVENFQILGVACQGETAERAIASLAAELGSGDPESEADAGVLGFDMKQARAVQTITKEQRDALRIIVNAEETQPSGAELEEAYEILREMIAGFTD